MLTATQMAPNKLGMFLVGGGQLSMAFGDGLRCVVSGPTGLHRFAPEQSSGPGSIYTLGPGIVAHSHAIFPVAGHIQAGGTYYFQTWFRDPIGSPCGLMFNLTNGLQVTFAP